MKTDVLILGAGLAGLRAAWAALEAGPDLDVHIVSLRHGPSGSSFANRNNRLGMRAPVTDEERTATVKLATELAAPGFIDEKLVTLLYDEADARLQELAELGLDFDRIDDVTEEKGDETELADIAKLPGCFGGPQSCALFNDLPGAFTAIRNHVAELGAKFISTHEVMGLVRDDEGVTGAWLGSLEDGRALCVSARAVIMALGGPAPLFARSLSGPGTPGNAYGLLAEAGATLKNTNFLQAMWTSRKSGEFRMPADFLVPGTTVRTQDGEIVLSDEPMLAQAGARRGHCPASYGLDDAAMDLWLLEHADECRCVEVKQAGGDWEKIYLAAHAGNGGAVIDGNGFTGIPGLFACGECATGMHGANRLGGAMISATQVFGRRAGQAAALTCKKKKAVDEATFTETCHAGINALPAQDWDDFEIFEEIGDGLQTHALYQPALGDGSTPSPGLAAFIERLKEIEKTAASRRVQLAARAALAVVG